MSTHQSESKRKYISDPLADERAAREGRKLTTLLPLLAVTVVAVYAITPLRETLSWASSSRPEPSEIRTALHAALNQVYRSFELDDETKTYDRIAQSVTGDAIRDIYLEVRKSLLDQDGGRVVIDRVRVGAVDGIEWQPDGGCRVDATWNVRGTVGHFGHFHERQNRYRARIELLPRGGEWKIRSIHISEYEREW
jgi:hypothetical protein